MIKHRKDSLFVKCLGTSLRRLACMCVMLKVVVFFCLSVCKCVAAATEIDDKWNRIEMSGVYPKDLDSYLSLENITHWTRDRKIKILKQIDNLFLGKREPDWNEFSSLDNCFYHYLDEDKDYIERLSAVEKIVKNVIANESDEFFVQNAVPLLEKIFFCRTFKKMVEKSGIRIRDNIHKMSDYQKLIYNQDGYDDTIFSSPIHKGAPLTVKVDEREYPIGYNIYLPKVGIKGIFVFVYGGASKITKDKFIYKTGILDSDQYSLLARDIACITLNLPDLTECDGFATQNMTTGLHNIIQASINQFFKHLKYYPRFFHPELHVLEGRKIFLMGRSFGGGLVLRHAARYPKTFDGYISFAGHMREDLHDEEQNMRITADHLKAVNVVNEIQDPVLLVHNANDINVDIRQSLEVFEKIKKQENDHLFSVFFPAMGGGYWMNTGHYEPKDRWYDDYIGTIESFIEKGPSKLLSLKEYRCELANRDRTLSRQPIWVKSLITLYQAGLCYFKKHPEFTDITNDKIFHIFLYFSLEWFRDSPLSVLYPDEKDKEKFNSTVLDHLTPDLLSYFSRFFEREVTKNDIEKNIEDLCYTLRPYSLLPKFLLLYTHKNTDSGAFIPSEEWTNFYNSECVTELWRKIQEGNFDIQPNTRKIWQEAAKRALSHR